MLSEAFRLCWLVFLIVIAFRPYASHAQEQSSVGTPSAPADDVIRDPLPNSRAPAFTLSPEQVAIASESYATANSVAPSETESSAKGRTDFQGEEPKFTISANLGLLLAGALGLQLEVVATPEISVVAIPSVFAVGVAGGGVNVGLQYFFEKRAPRGFWVAPNVGFAVASSSDASAAAAGWGGMVGFSWLSEEDWGLPATNGRGKLFLSGGAGVGYTFLVSSDSTSNRAVIVDGFAPTLRAAIGLAF